MGWFKTRARLRMILVGASLAAALALPAAVSADTTPGSSGDATVTVGSTVHVTAKVAATVDVAFTCDPFMVFDWETGMEVPSTSGHLEFGRVTITQAAGRSIASAATEFSGGDVVCDGTTIAHRSVTVMATSAPWKSGAAVADASVHIVDDQFQSSRNGSSGPIVVKLTK